MMLKTYKTLALLLSYPQEELQQFLAEATDILISEKLLPTDEVQKVAAFIDHFAREALLEWQAHYVQLFDFGRSTSLHLFEHVMGVSKDRGQAMVDLLELYNQNGLQMSVNELPDYLPVFLEFLSTQPADRAAELLASPIDIIARIGAALAEKDNPYHQIFSAIISLSAVQPDLAKARETVRNQKPKHRDAEYDEPPVDFSNSCINCK
ncbi:MAG: nitrate reductase molybdenum cofactor assembly chaperone [Bacteroidales bacterium]|jgi:nitrate reductase delta subunit|nr:nitrate reductase molybdenum cofactor assembly chaperone [Bacteroidales bacterium]NCU36345.1 nitrate reductase molybdenum cofactor assembly chaperone [Candidatus Falkowbacteria bacterium]MDD2633047.1 nitrate reductase molybdenum cofactor assembly chaperone [Bacteroidales bacterium]MDD3130656.1 nitrate reductase molybdenum cofactor assembly chaperone [Bacteroidales bacterium]MDD3525539.1 nitrate reductase molybdenum cofactor assembly chaperone [Bacteroidales bacterium]